MEPSGNLPGLTIRYAILLTGVVGAAIVYSIGNTEYTLFLYLFCALIVLIGTIVIVRGRLRDVVLMAASTLLCLIFMEGYQIVQTKAWTRQAETVPFTPDPTLGWGLSAPGVFRSKKVDTRSGNVIFDVVHTIDKDLQRKTISSESGPKIVFFGDSFTFGDGLEDSETLPQIFSDLENRRLHVLNFGLSGYGPQQFLRAMETGIFRDRLKESRLFVLQTAGWHAERTSCMQPGMLESPRYVLQNGRATYTGPCAEGLDRIVRETLGKSAAYRALVTPAVTTLRRADIELYLAIVARAVEIAREEYGVPTLILYLPYVPAYLSQTGYTDAEIMQKLREAGAVVIDATINPVDHLGTVLFIPGDGHPTGATNRLWAGMLKDWLDGSGEYLLKREARAR
jgi:hypothetical protein